jgi:serine/threonine protein kinase
MNESTTPSRGDDQLLLQFQQECEAAADRTALLEEWCARAPHLATRLRARVEMAAMLARTRPQADEATPQQLGEFKIVRRLGVSMGEVFEAWQPSLKRRVAIKTIRRGRISPEARDLFLREQQVLAGLHQTHIVPIHAAGEEAGLQYFVMPYIDGAALHHVVHLARNWNSSATAGKTPPLKELAKQAADRHQGSPAPAGHCTTLDAVSAPDSPADQPPAPPLSSAYFRSVAQVMSDAADALQHAHDAHILHRDLKPSNLMVDRQGHCWIIDFGLAGVLTTAPGDSASKNGVEATGKVNDSPPTVSGIMGTPPYMAPEQWHGTADQRSDVYGLGVTLYELLTLTCAFAGEDRDAIKRQVMAGVQRSPRQAAPNIPLDLDAICTKAMNKDAVKRYSTPKLFAEDLRNWLNGQPTLARPAWWPRRLGLWAKRNKGWATALTLLMIVLAIGAAALGMIQERNREAERQNLIRQAQGRRLNFREAGWSKEAWAQLRQAAHIRVDDLLRSEAASSLMGLDVVRPKEFKDEGACSLAFHPSGKKLILGAQPVRKNRREPKNPRLPIRIRDQDTDVVKETTLFDVGPVAYDKQGKPLALTVKKNEAALVPQKRQAKSPNGSFQPTAPPPRQESHSIRKKA